MYTLYQCSPTYGSRPKFGSRHFINESRLATRKPINKEIDFISQMTCASAHLKLYPNTMRQHPKSAVTLTFFIFYFYFFITNIYNYNLRHTCFYLKIIFILNRIIYLSIMTQYCIIFFFVQ